MRSYRHPEDYFLFFDRNYLFHFSDRIAGMPFHGNFPTEADYLFERNRDQAKQLVREHYPRLHVPDVKPFDEVLEALEFLKSTEQLWAIGRSIRCTKVWTVSLLLGLITDRNPTSYRSIIRRRY
jgi:hypothetical protein